MSNPSGEFSAGRAERGEPPRAGDVVYAREGRRVEPSHGVLPEGDDRPSVARYARASEGDERLSKTLRELLWGESQGVLATISARVEGWPFASVTPYAVTDEGEPLFLFSDLAEHTRNVRRDARASLLVQDSAALADPQSGGRATLLGSVEAVTATEIARVRQRYLEKHPQSADYLALGDFRFYVLRVGHVRFVGGFGDMGWLDADRFHAALSESTAPPG